MKNKLLFIVLITALSHFVLIGQINLIQQKHLSTNQKLPQITQNKAELITLKREVMRLKATVIALKKSFKTYHKHISSEVSK